MKKIAALLAAVPFIALAAPAAAQDASAVRGMYVSINAGIADVKDIDVTYFDEGGTFGGTGTRDDADFEATFKNAFNVSGAIGYDFGTVRTELQVDYARNRVKSLALRSINGQAVTLTAADRSDVCDYLEADSCGGSGNSFDVDGSHLRQLSALANIWFDVPTGSAVTPYVGGGIGVSGFELDGEGKARFGWQLGAGVSVDVSPSLALTADFRRRQMSGTTITDDDFPGAGVEVGKLKTNIISAGLRFRF